MIASITSKYKSILKYKILFEVKLLRRRFTDWSKIYSEFLSTLTFSHIS